MSFAAALLALSVLSPLQMMPANLSSPPSDFTNVRRSFSNALCLLPPFVPCLRASGESSVYHDDC